MDEFGTCKTREQKRALGYNDGNIYKHVQTLVCTWCLTTHLSVYMRLFGYVRRSGGPKGAKVLLGTWTPASQTLFLRLKPHGFKGETRWVCGIHAVSMTQI